EVARNKGESDNAAAVLELTLARLDIEKYTKGDYLVSLNDLKGKIALAEVDLEKAESALRNTRDLLKKGFREPEQVRVAEQEVARAKFHLQRDQETLKMTETYDHARKLTEYEAKAKEADRKLARAKSTAEANTKKAEGALAGAEAELEIRKEDKADTEKQKERCEIKAMQSGVVAYANEEWWGEDRRIREGGTVYERQVVFFIPDMELMQVEVRIHESEVKRIAAGQKAVIRVDAFANQSFTGTVKNVAQLSKSDGFFGGGVKEYTTIVVFDEKAQVALRPGMTAEVEILVDSMRSVLAVPVQGVAEHGGRHFVYRHDGKKIQQTDVEIGATNNRMVQVTSGIAAGDMIALDARSRAAEQFRDAEVVENLDVTKLADRDLPKPSTDVTQQAPDVVKPAEGTNPSDEPDAPALDHRQPHIEPAAAVGDRDSEAAAASSDSSPPQP
ncbi:MAG: efflux RND transporter periplasmic adaptor subunit, partial [Planctomycetota bacterium]